MKEYMLSTIDNPWNPFKNFDEWLQFDLSHSYNTLAYVARIAKTDSEMEDKTYSDQVNKAIDEILKYNYEQAVRKLIETIGLDNSIKASC